MQSLAYSIFLNPRLYWIPEMFPFLHLGETIYDPDFHIRPFTEIQAQQGLVALKRLKEENVLRQQRGLYYSNKLKEGDGIVLPKPLDSSFPIYLRYPIFLKDKNQRSKIFKSLQAQRLGVHFMYPSSIGDIDGISSHLNRKTNQEIGKQVAERLLTLPTHAFSRKKEIRKIEILLK